MKSTLCLSPLSAALLLALSAPALADMAPDPDARQLDAVQVQGTRVEKAASPKYTETLLDTPQTITVVSKGVMDQQNLIGLRDVLSTLPGITFGAGEGGGGYGDSINLRGYSANSDITLDGVRDSAQYTRSDNFNLEAIELVNGANSVYSGAGSVGGNINLVSKAAQEGDSSTATLAVGSDRYARATADTNFDLDNGVAVRLNAMAHQNDVPGRDHENFQRWGFAPSVAFGLGSDTRFTLSYLHQSDDNLPQYGVPYALNAFNDGPLPGIDPETYFGYRNVSRQEIDVDVLTGVFEHDFSDALSLRSLGRLQRVDQLANVTALQGSWCLQDGTSPYTGAACAGGQPTGTWFPNSGPRGLVRDTRNFIAYSQTDLSARFDTGAITHDLVAGVSLAKEDFELESGSVFRNADGSAVADAAFPLQNFSDPYNVWTGPLNYFRTGQSKGSLQNTALYVFDTLGFGERWSLNLGARYERNEGSTTIDGADARFDNEDNLFSYRAGVVFKPVANASVYLSYANSKTPSKASVGGACNDSNCNVDPESAANLELGAKWEVLDQRLALTAAVFRNERENYRVADNTPGGTGEQVLDGRSRVTGVALGAAGRVTDAWSVFANYTYLDSEVLQGVSDFCLGNPGAIGCVNSIAYPDPTAGNDLTNTPRHSLGLWTTYALGDWSFGYGATYQGEFITQNSSLGGAALYEVPDYWVHRAMVGYQVNERLGLQLNVSNLTDEEYYTRIRNNANNGWATPGEGRAAVLTATYRF
jgi:catecholate siderophore receptor